MSEIFPFAQLAFFLLQILIIASLLLFFFRIRSVFGLGLLYVSLGVFQLLQVVFSLAIHVEILPGLVISPGSAVLFTGSLFAILIVYIQEDAAEVRKIIYALLATNLLISVLLFLFGLNLDSPEVQNLYNLPKEMLIQNIRFLVVGTLALALDTLLLIVAYEYISRYISAFFFRILLTMALVLSFDTLLFITGSFIENPDFVSLLMSGLAGKLISVFIYSMIVYFYFRVFERSQPVQNQSIGRFEDIFHFLTYRQKYEKAASNYQHLLDNSSDVILIFEPNHLTLLEANAIAGVTYGYTRDEFIGMGFNKLMKDAARCESEIRGILENGLDRSFETVHVHRTGEEIPFDVRLSVVDYDGQKAVLCVSRNITDSKQAKMMLIESEHRYQTLATISPVGIFRTDANGSTTYVNPEWCNIAGLSLEDALGDGWINAIHPDDKDNLIRGWQASTRQHKESFSEYRFLRQDGTIAWVMGQAVPEINPENQIVGYVGTITDITERKQAEQALRESEENYRQVFENVRDVLYTISPEGLLESINPAFEELTGWSVKEWLGKPFAALVHPDDLPLAAKAFQTVMSGGKIPIYELRILKKSGEYLVGEFSPSALGYDNIITGTLGVARDITDRKQSQAELLRTEQILRLFVSYSPAAIAMFDCNMNYILTSKRYLADYRLGEQNLIGRSQLRGFSGDLRKMERDSSSMPEWRD